MRGRKGNAMSFLARGVLCIGVLVLSISSANAFCFKGVSRTIKVGPGFGASSVTGDFQAAVALRAKEVILTFDDGPLPGVTDRILNVLDQNCVKATFFVVGRMALAEPALTRRIRADGHTIAVHGHTHLNLLDMDRPAAVREIRAGYGAIQAALNGKEAAPFFRFPFLAENHGLQKYLVKQGIAVFGGGKDLIDSDDWMDISSEDVAQRVMARLRSRGRGVILMHDIQPKTARALPHILAALDEGGYKIVHLLPKAGVPDDLAINSYPRLPRPETDEEEEARVATLSARARERAFSVKNFIDNVK